MERPNHLRRLTPRSLGIFALQFGLMLDVGINIASALETLTATSDPELNEAVLHLKGKIISGSSLSQALASLPEAFPPFFVNVVRINEKTGKLAGAFARLAQFLFKEERKRLQITQALTYPCCILLLSFAMVAFMVFYMVPQFNAVFLQSGAQIPGLTRTLMAVTRPSMILAGLATLLVALLLIVPFFRTPLGKIHFQRLIYDSPLMGHYFRTIVIERLSRTLAVLIRSTGNIALSLKTICMGTTGYYLLDAGLADVLRNISQDGMSFSEALAQHPVFPRMLISIVAAGEATGEVSDLLDQYAALQEFQSELALQDFIKVLEPCMLFIMGFVVGFIVLAAFLPVFQLIQTL
ncbi:MAG: type II secretion system F family protein [Candidatus Eremiobacteraeota bacterium]|nr:type II secretion system F family protein [Candidatus Eremiobacteraeota bacterium]